MHRDRLNERGVILIALLWILMALTVIALSFSRESFVEVAVARNSRDLADAYYVARAGMSAVIYQLIEKRRKPRVFSARHRMLGPRSRLLIREAKVTEQ